MNKAIQLVMYFMLSLGFTGASFAAGLDEIPADIRADLYDPKLTDPAQPIEASLYRDWKSKRPPPWTIGYASTYAGNTWRKGAMQRLLGEVLPKWQKLGLIKDIIVTQSNLKDSLQIQQMRQLVDQGRRRYHHLLFKSDGTESNGEICLRQGCANFFIYRLCYIALCD